MIKQNYLNEKFFSPMVKVFKRFHDVHVINKDATISTSVESHTKTLKPLLTSSIPNLRVRRKHLNFRWLLSIYLFHILQEVQIHRRFKIAIPFNEYHGKWYSQTLITQCEWQIRFYKTATKCINVVHEKWFRWWRRLA